MQKYISKNQLEEWAKFYAREDSEKKNIWAQAEWLIFAVENQQYAVSMNKLDEVSTVSVGCTIPRDTNNALGMINLRGEVILAFDLGKVFGSRTQVQPTDRQRLLIFKGDRNQSDNYEDYESVRDRQRTAFLVDEILTVVDIPEENLQRLDDSDMEREKNNYLEAVTEGADGKSTGIININKLIAGCYES